MKLTISNIKAIEPAGKEVFYWDDDLPGFGLRVQPSGVRSYLIQYRNKSGRSRRLRLARHGVMTPHEARREAHRLLAAVAGGEDPAADRRRARQALTVADLAARYLSDHLEAHNKPSTRREFRRIVERDILPVLGSRGAAEVTRDDIARLHRARQKAPRVANLMLAVLSKMFALAELWGIRPEHSNPARGIERYPERKRTRFLTDEELGRLGEAMRRAAREAAIPPARLAAVRLLALCGLRLGEALALRWEHVDLAEGVLRLPDAKGGARVHALGAESTALLDELRPPSRPDGWVFQGDGGLGPLTADRVERAWQWLRAAAGLADARLHDLRHTVGTYAGQTGANAFMVRDKLGHKTLAMTGRYVNQDAAPIRLLSDRVESRIARGLAAETAEPIPLPPSRPGAPPAFARAGLTGGLGPKRSRAKT